MSTEQFEPSMSEGSEDWNLNGEWVEWLTTTVSRSNAGWWQAVADVVRDREGWGLSPKQQAFRQTLATSTEEIRDEGADLAAGGALHLASCTNEFAVLALLQYGAAVDEPLSSRPWARLARCFAAGPEPAPQPDGPVGAESPFDATGGCAALRQLEDALDGAAPLHCAAICGHAANVHLLLAAGAGAERRTARGATAAQLALSFAKLHAPEATGEIVRALAAQSRPQSVHVYAHVCMAVQEAQTQAAATAAKRKLSLTKAMETRAKRAGVASGVL